MDEKSITQKHKQLQLTYDDFKNMKNSLQNMKIGQYNIHNEIIDKTTQRIYDGVNSQNNSPVIIKLIILKHIDLEKDHQIKKIKKRLADSESKIMMSLNSKYVLKCFESFQNRTFKIIVTEHCNGGSLQGKINQKGNIPEEDAILILKQIISGVAQCHRKKTIHRNLKADNILINNGEYKLAGFGLSKILNIQNPNQTLQGTNISFFSASTMAPQVINQKPYGLKADIWSIGIIFFQMLFGMYPFEIYNQNNFAILQKMLDAQELKGVKISKDAKNFLKHTLVVQIENRLGWEQLVNHDIFKARDQSLPNEFHMIAPDVKLGFDVEFKGQYQWQEDKKSSSSVLDVKQEHNTEIYGQQQLKKEREQYNRRNEGILQTLLTDKESIANNSFNVPSQNMNKRHSQIVQLKPVGYPQVQKSKALINKSDDELFKLANKMHFDCLKTQALYNNIVEVIDDNPELFDMRKRQIIEMMYLICTRCLKDMSCINFQYKNNETSQILSDLKSLVSHLFQKVFKMWQKYSDLVTIKQNQLFSRLFDLGNRIFHRTQYQQKDLYMVGVQNFDYTRQKQIQYTCKYIQNVLKGQKELDTTTSIRSYLRKFKEICNIKSEDLNKKTLRERISVILM